MNFFFFSQREKAHDIYVYFNRRETDLTTFYLKTQRKAKRKKKEKKERGTDSLFPDTQRRSGHGCRRHPFFLSFASLLSSDFLPFLRFRLQFRPRVLLENCFSSSSLFLNFSCVGFSFYWDTFVSLFFFDLSTVI